MALRKSLSCHRFNRADTYQLIVPVSAICGGAKAVGYHTFLGGEGHVFSPCLRSGSPVVVIGPADLSLSVWGITLFGTLVTVQAENQGFRSWCRAAGIAVMRFCIACNTTHGRDKSRLLRRICLRLMVPKGFEPDVENVSL